MIFDWFYLYLKHVLIIISTDSCTFTILGVSRILLNDNIIILVIDVFFWYQQRDRFLFLFFIEFIESFCLFFCLLDFYRLIYTKQ